MPQIYARLLGESLSQLALIVDDEPMARTLLRLMLVRAGFNVSEAEDGFDALEKVQTSQPDIILLDVMMPGTAPTQRNCHSANHHVECKN